MIRQITQLILFRAAIVIVLSSAWSFAGDASPLQFWSLKPVQKPEAPPVTHQSWVKTPIDAFVMAELESRGLAPAAPADRATFIRRASYDLLGLPPTVPELRAFEKDTSPDAYEKLIDRLLASPHYGERWGRHWLDVARYTPGRISFPGVKHTAGDSDYRNYVVRAFNNDKPYDQFVIEQLAGDLLKTAADRQQEFDQITAPAFLSIGPWFDMCTDPNRLRLEMIDDMISATGKTFLGLSLGCARCHDHKFDPVPTADYYALAGIFRSTRIVGDFSEYWRDGRVRLLRPLAMPDEVAANQNLRDQVNEAEARRWKLLTDRHAELLARWQADEAKYRTAAATIPKPWIRNFEAEDFDGVYNLRTAELSADGKVVQVIETLNPLFQWVRYKIDIPENGAGKYRLEALYCSAEKLPVTLQVNGATVTEAGLPAASGGWDLKYRRWEKVADFELHSSLNFLRVTRKEGNFPRIDKFRLYRIDGDLDANVARLAGQNNLDPSILAAFVTDSEHPWPSPAGVESLLDVASKQKLAEIDGQMQQIESQIHPYSMVVAVTDQPKVTELPIHPRGVVEATGGQPISRSVPSLLDQALPRPTMPTDSSGRLQLAQWIVDPHNPLSSRVMANRIWQWHFGRGIVETPSDFGTRGARPSNPALLDWLASTFVEQGWSIKKLHRTIMLSNAYRMSGQGNTIAEAADPDDRLLWRFAPRRLDTEEMFDSMFSATNILIRQSSGPLDLQKALGRGMYVLTTNRVPPGLGPDVRKMMMLFDLDMSGASIDRRGQSSTAAQSLFWLNSPIPKYYAEKFADRLLKMDKLNNPKRLEQAYLIALGHSPDAKTSAAALAYLDELEQSQGMSAKEAWAKIAQAIFASEEFHYVR